MRHFTAALLVAAVAACSSNRSSEVTATSDNSQSTSQQELGKAFAMKIGDSIALNDVRVTFQRVAADSRCAVDVTCVWAGDAEIALKVEQGTKSAVASLHTTLDPKKTEWNGYTIALVSVSPERHASAGIDPADYRAEIVITR